MAEQLRVSQQHYSRLEADGGRVTYEQLEKTAQVFGVSVYDIASLDEKYVFNNFGGGTYTNENIINQHSLASDKEELYQATLAKRDEEIAYLKSLIEQ